jgi:DNA-directed RNA polymerase
MIHDSYGTHAADSQFLAEMLRQVFVKMFSDNLLENLLEGIKSQVPGKPPGDFPPVPVTGTLDITSVLESRFFFA